MRSALLAVEGVSRVQVMLEQGEVVVTYDSHATTVERLIEIIDAAPGPISTPQYEASVKEPPRPAASAP